MNRLLVLIAILAISTTAHAEQWYYINTSHQAKTLETECVALPPGQTPQQSLSAHFHDDKSLTNTANFLLPDGSHAMVYEHDDTEYAFANTIPVCLGDREVLLNADKEDHVQSNKRDQSRIIGFYPGNGEQIPPISFTHETCVPGGKVSDGYRAIWHLRFQGDIEACWNFDKDDAIITCVTKDGKRNGLVGGDCRWISKSHVLDPATLPRSAF